MHPFQNGTIISAKCPKLTANFETTVNCMEGKKKKIDIIRKRLVLEIHWASYYVHVPTLILSSVPAPSNEICTSKVLYDSLNPGICHNSACEARCTRDTRDVHGIQENLYGKQVIKSNLPPKRGRD